MAVPRPGTPRSPGSPWERRWRGCGPLPQRRAAAGCDASARRRASPRGQRSLLRRFFGALRAGKKSFEERAKIESGSSADDGQVPSLPLSFCAVAANDLAQNLPRLAGIFSGGDFGERVGAIEQVMRNFRALGRSGLGRADFKFAVHGDRVAVDDFSAKAPGDPERQRRLPARRGSEHDYDQRLAIQLLNSAIGNPGNFSARSKECTASSG